MNGNFHRINGMIRMSLPVFKILVNERRVTRVSGLHDTRVLPLGSNSSIFLFFAAQRAFSRNMQEQFQHSGKIITRSNKLHEQCIKSYLDRLDI